MLEAEHFKGLVYIRISSLPPDQRNSIRAFYNQEKVIKIIKDNSLLNDCLLYEDYTHWFQIKNLTFRTNPEPKNVSELHPAPAIVH